MLVQFVCAAFLTIQCKRRAFFAQEKSPFGKITQADDFIKSAWTDEEEKGRAGVRKMGFKGGMERPY